jgi:hypothetical protein
VSAIPNTPVLPTCVIKTEVMQTADGEKRMIIAEWGLR